MDMFFTQWLLIILLSVISILLWLRLRKIETAMSDCQLSLQLAEQVGGVGSWQLDSATKEVHWSPYVYTMHGRKIEKGVPELLKAIHYYHPDDRAMVGKHIEDALAQGKDFEFRARIIGEDGIERNILSRGICRLAANGNVTGIYGAFVDLGRSDLPARYT